MTRKSKLDQREPKNTITNSDPVAGTHHEGAGYSVGSRWINTSSQTEFVCMVQTNPATWQEVGSGSGGSGHNTIYADTYEVSESGGGPVIKKTFDYVNDSTTPATLLKLIVGLWMTGGGTATCTFEVDAGPVQVSDTATSTASAEEDIQKVTLNLGSLTAYQDATMTVNIKLHQSGGTTAHLKYTEVRELFS